MAVKNAVKSTSKNIKKTGTSASSTISNKDVKLKLIQLENKYLELSRQVEDIFDDFQQRLSEFKKIEKALKESLLKKQDEKRIREILSKIK